MLISISIKKYITYSLDHYCKYFKHYEAIGRGIHNFKQYVENGSIAIDIGQWYEIKSIRRALGWSKETGEKIEHNGVVLNDHIAKTIIKYIEKLDFDLKEHFNKIKKDL